MRRFFWVPTIYNFQLKKICLSKPVMSISKVTVSWLGKGWLLYLVVFLLVCVCLDWFVFWPRGYKTCFMPNWTEHKVSTLKIKMLKNKDFTCFQTTRFFIYHLFIILTIVCILTFMVIIHFILSRVEHEKFHNLKAWCLYLLLPLVRPWCVIMSFPCHNHLLLMFFMFG